MRSMTWRALSISLYPEVRATAAAALASLVRGLGADQELFGELMPWLVETLQSDGPMTARHNTSAACLTQCNVCV
jgi:hypothetical protein